MKECYKCKCTLPDTSFYKTTSNKSGLSSSCKTCTTAKESLLKNPPSDDAKRQYRARYKAKHPDRIKAQGMRQGLRKAGLSEQAYTSRLQAQLGVCAICFRPERSKATSRLCIDHDHRTGEIRGLLCTTCNTAIGKLSDSPTFLRSAAFYLERPTRRLIGICGRKGSGKDASASRLYAHGFQKEFFAKPLKEAVRSIFGWGLEHTDGKLKETVDEHWGLSPRFVMQQLGTDCARHLDPDVWVKSLRRRILCSTATSHVIADVRFPNEAAMIKSMGGEIWRVVRPALGERTDLHPSETSMDDYVVDRELVNNGSLEDLYAQVDKLLEGYDADA